MPEEAKRSSKGVSETARDDCNTMLHRGVLCLHPGGECPLCRIITTEPFNCKTVPVKSLLSQDHRNDQESLGGQDFGSNSSRVVAFAWSFAYFVDSHVKKLVMDLLLVAEDLLILIAA
ncbi:UNVERIFIED_CONTAM: hypothetical protein FKN15_054487 [Acipenser sinensis]